jgi:MSHA biogenesis protein MshJ
MTSWWKKMTARFDALRPRERYLVAMAILGGIAVIGHSLFIEPALLRERAARRGIAEARAQADEARAQMISLGAPENHPDVAARRDLEALRTMLGALSERLRALESALVPPERMTTLLEEMIGVKGGLRVVSLKILPPAPFVVGGKENKGEGDKAGGKDEKAGTSTGLYRHGVEIRLEGRYQDLAAYLERLEKSPVKLLWGTVALSAEDHPRIVLTLTVYSLSMNRAWLIV